MTKINSFLVEPYRTIKGSIERSKLIQLPKTTIIASNTSKKLRRIIIFKYTKIVI